MVIVGGGVLGTMHAVMARRRGFSVVHLEREPEARGASVRNFGLVWVSGRRAGPELALALREGRLDVAFLRPPLKTEEGLTLHLLEEEDMVVAVPSGHGGRRGSKQRGEGPERQGDVIGGE